MMLRGTQINYMLDKSHLIIIIIINTQCQIIQIQRCSKKLCRIWKVVATIRSAKQEPNKIPFSAQVQIRASFYIENGILRDTQVPFGQANLFDISAALASLVWPTRRRVLQRAVSHLAARIDNND